VLVLVLVQPQALVLAPVLVPLLEWQVLVEAPLEPQEWRLGEPD